MWKGVISSGGQENGLATLQQDNMKPRVSPNGGVQEREGVHAATLVDSFFRVVLLETISKPEGLSKL